MGKSLTGKTAFLLCAIVALAAAGHACSPADPLQGRIYTFTPTTDTGEKPAPGTTTITNPTTTDAPDSQSKTQETTRNVTVTEANSIFSIGLPPGYTEEREIKASAPIDVWFEYLKPDVSLEINGTAVDIPLRRTTARVGYMQGVTQLKYVMKNPTAQYFSYNLHMMPVSASGQVPLVTTERWFAP